MAITPLSAFTLQQASSVVALGTPKAFAIPTGTSPTTLLVSNLGPETSLIALTTAAATTTATQAVVGSYTITVASAIGISIGQNVVGVGIFDGSSIPASPYAYPNTYPNSSSTTTVTGINGDVITLSTPTVAALSSTTVNFINPISGGMAVVPGVAPIPLAIGSNTFIQTVCTNFGSKSLLNLAVGV